MSVEIQFPRLREFLVSKASFKERDISKRFRSLAFDLAELLGDEDYRNTSIGIEILLDARDHFLDAARPEEGK